MSENASNGLELAPAPSSTAEPVVPARALKRIDPREVWPEDDTETSRVLLSMTHRKTGRIPGDLLVRHVISITSGGDWPLRRGAMEAVLRRCKSVDEGRFSVKSRSVRRGALGEFTVGRSGGARSHETRIGCVDPLEASCDCDDFIRNSLALCKHVLAVLEKRRIAGASAGQRWTDPGRGKPLPRLGWEPVRPLTGCDDWLERVEVRAADGVRPEHAFHASLRGAITAREGGGWALAQAVLRDPQRRLAAVERLMEHADGASAKGRRSIHADPAVRALLEHERARLDVAVRGRVEGRELRVALRSLKRKLYPYQVTGVEAFLRAGRLLLADDMGLGKTAQAIAACHVLFHAGRVRHGVIIAPASLKSQWLREWQLFTDVPAVVVEGGADERARLWKRSEPGFLITNYEQVLRDLASVHRRLPDMVVLDEAQRIKNWETKTARCVKELKPPYRLVLTGTPMENRLEELASVVEWVDDLALEPKWRLVPWHATAVDGKSEVGGARHIDTLRQRLGGSLLRRNREEVLDQLPSRTDTHVPVEFTAQQQQEHDSFNMPIASLARRARSRPLTPAEFVKLMQMLSLQRMIANGIALSEFEAMWPDLQRVEDPAPEFLRTLSSPKLLELREILRQVVVEQKRKVVVFSQWRRMLTLAHWASRDILDAAGARAAFFTGEESQQQRTKNVIDLHDDPQTRVLFLTDCGGVGLNLQRAASCCINLEVPWNPAVLEQRVGRIYRLGQSRPIDVYNLVTEGSLEGRIASLVQDKKALFKGLFDGDADEVRFERSGAFISRVEKLLPPEKLTAPLPSAPVDEAAEDDDLETLASSDEAREAPDDAVPSPRSRTEVADEPATPPPSNPDPFTGVTVVRAPDGGLTLQARPEAAATLATLFEGFARLLRTVTP